MASRSALVTALFTDVAGSTCIANELGDGRWRGVGGPARAIALDEATGNVWVYPVAEGS